jgi:hypothetical protein
MFIELNLKEWKIIVVVGQQNTMLQLPKGFKQILMSPKHSLVHGLSWPDTKQFDRRIQ